MTIRQPLRLLHGRIYVLTPTAAYRPLLDPPGDSELSEIRQPIGGRRDIGQIEMVLHHTGRGTRRSLQKSVSITDGWIYGPA